MKNVKIANDLKVGDLVFLKPGWSRKSKPNIANTSDAATSCICGIVERVDTTIPVDDIIQVFIRISGEELGFWYHFFRHSQIPYEAR